MKRPELKAASLAGAAIALGLAFSAPLRVLAQQTICAVVKLQIQQQATLEREGFDANLQISNNLPTQPLTNLKVQIFIKDSNGNPADSSFFVKVSSLTGTSAVDGTGVVQSSASAAIDWLIIPSSGTGGSSPAGQQYAVSAVISAISNGAAQNITTFAANITVHPQPVIKLEYALPYEVFGDEPLTSAIEPVEPYPVAVRATNIGFGTANNFQIQSAQPQIVDNKQGLAVDFKLLGTVVNGQTIPNTLLLPFGNVAPNQVSQGAWVMASSLSGRFISFTSTFTHAADLGGNLTSLLQSVTTYTLLKDVLVDLPGRDNIPDYLVNETQDRGTMQTQLDAGVQPAAQYILESDQPNPLPVTEIPGAVSGVLNGANAALTFTFTQGVSSNVWVHSYTPFSYGNSVTLTSARRADGKVMNPANVWISKHFNKNTLTDVYWINVLDLTSSTNTYVIQFNPSGLVIPPGQVADLTATPASDGGDVAMTWTAPGEGGNSGFLFGGRYLIEAETSSTTIFSPANAQLSFTTSTPPGVPQSINMPGLIGNSTYYFHMWTQNGGGGIAALSNAATAYALPNPPTNLLFTTVGSTYAAGNWRIGNNNLPILYQVSAATVPGGVAVSSSPLEDSFSTSYVFGGLTPNTTFFFNGIGLSSGNATASPAAPLGTLLTLAAPPAAVQLVAVGTSSVAAAWSPGADPPGTQFLVELSTTVDLFPPTYSSGWITGSSFTFAGVGAQFVYSGRVKARNSALIESSYTELGTTAFGSAITPATGAGGSAFSIAGANFGVFVGTTTNRVQFGPGGPLAAITSWNDSRISGTVPVLSTGAYAVLVERQAGATVTTTQAGTFVIGNISASSGPVITLSPFDGEQVASTAPAIVASFTDSTAAISTASAHLTLDGVDVTTRSFVTAGSASFTPSATLSQGTHTVTASVADAAAFVSTAAATFLVDTVAPVTSLLVDGVAAASTATVVVSTDALSFSAFDAGSGAVDTVYIVDADLNSCDFTNFVSTAPPGTCANPYYTTPFSLSAGTHTLSFYSDDAAGNSEDLNVVSVLVLPAPSPLLLTLNFAPGSFIAESFPPLSAFYTDLAAAVATTTVRLSLDGVDVTTQSAVAASSATFVPVAAVADGTHTFAASAADFFNDTSSVSAAFLVDTIPPITTLSIDSQAVAGSSFTITPADTLSLAATDAGSGVSNTFYVIDSDPFSTDCANTSLDNNAPSGTFANETYNGPFTLAIGTHTIYYFSEDYATNQETENVSSFTVTVQALPLSISWTGAAADGLWQTPANWNPPQIPTSIDSVTIAVNSTVMAPAGTAPLFGRLELGDPAGYSKPILRVDGTLSGGALILDSNATLLSNTTQTMTLAYVYASTASLMTHLPVSGILIPILSLQVSGNMTLSTGARIDVSGDGYVDQAEVGAGPGGGNVAGGGSHGGLGGAYQANAQSPYDDLASPSMPGSSGGGFYDYGPFPGGSGGGVVMLRVAGTLRIDGFIAADGSAPLSQSLVFMGGGAGGTVNIRTGVLFGNGRIEANGGAGFTYNGSQSAVSGGGSGGRIAVDVSQNDGSALAYQASGGLPSPYQAPDPNKQTIGGAGTIYKHNPNQQNYSLTIGGSGSVPGLAGTVFQQALLVDTLTVAGAVLQWTGSPQAVTVTAVMTLEDAFGISATTFTFPTSGITSFSIPAGSFIKVETISHQPSWNWLVNGTLVVASLQADNFVAAGDVEVEDLEVNQLSLISGRLITSTLTVSQATSLNVPAGAFLQSDVLNFPVVPWSIAGSANVSGGPPLTAQSLNLTGTLVVSTLTVLSAPGVTLPVGSDLIAETLVIASSSTLDVSGELQIANGIQVGSFYLRPQAQAGPSRNLGIFEVDASNDIVISSGAVISAAGLGYQDADGYGSGPDAGCPQGGGGGHGGAGGLGSSIGIICPNLTYGNPQNPRESGSSGSSNPQYGTPSYGIRGGPGGGVIALHAGRNLTVDGLIDANGLSGSEFFSFALIGGGAGGSVNLSANAVSGGGVVRANGAGGETRPNDPTNSNTGGGGGGRVAITALASDVSNMTVTANGGPAGRSDISPPYPGGSGSIFRSVPSQSFTWIGAAGDGSWSTPGNWSPARIPTAVDTVTIAAYTTVVIASGTIAAFARLELGDALGNSVTVLNVAGSFSGGSLLLDNRSTLLSNTTKRLHSVAT